MKQILIRYGLISALVLIGINVLSLLILGVPGPEDYDVGEIVGYSTIIIAMVPVFFGIRNYRDELSGGVLTFWKGVGVGLAIVTVPSIAFAAYNLVYVNVIDPTFNEMYKQYMIDSARESMSAEEFEAYSAQIESQSAMLTDPIIQTVLMFFTVFLIGIAAAIVSSIILRRSAVTVDTTAL